MAEYFQDSPRLWWCLGQVYLYGANILEGETKYKQTTKQPVSDSGNCDEEFKKG